MTFHVFEQDLTRIIDHVLSVNADEEVYEKRSGLILDEDVERGK